MKLRVIFVLLISILFLSQITGMNLVNAEPKFPKATELKYVNDYAKVIDNNSAQYILSVGRELEAKTGAEATVVVVDSLQGETIETYANGIFRSWGIGQKDKNNGLLILLSMKEKQWRVEVGTGLEGAVTDIYSARVMNELAVPKFKQGKYGEGFKAAYSTLADNIAKEYNVKLEKNVNVQQINQNEKGSNMPNKGSGILFIGFIGLVILDFIFNRGRITKFILTLLFWSSIGRRGGGNGGGFGGSGGGSGGFGGGSSSGGGSSGGF
ncbi:TPM domain-containing protein [Clostridium algoriphilum]|uniref:TPM domain-containing protein n=1 Tax=Clostridium algoriphilum TaxID=198347 RepID=UPI001CF4B986|nr:TPM domain-containing protein [Clostridium algoriphilum]MCB2293223.1 TPM domain-containing protein [Clostridium algoriphilum]